MKNALCVSELGDGELLEGLAGVVARSRASDAAVLARSGWRRRAVGVSVSSS